ncbi:sarcosine oxidase subunit gamma [Roseicyclus sp.]|uniref:sarcosine oxidase subunit gamma n=1 Tax=Roseicyclus sp. TaxID=1914329 RepID=UPI003F9ECA39
MADLIAKTPFAGLLPLRAGTVEATEARFEAITSVTPFRGRADAVSAALETATGLRLPPPNGTSVSGAARAVWTGMDQCFVLGPAPGALSGAAVTDQSDAWAAVLLSGPDAREVLARLVPVDLRPEVFGVDAAARTLLGHMSCVLVRTGADDYLAMVFRSMAGTAAHELERALRMVAARRRG